MSSFGEHYRVNENYNFELKEGEYDAKISKVELKNSKSGKPMACITFVLENKAMITYYLVDDRSTPEHSSNSDARITRFFDCFNIKRGNFQIKTWINAKGRVKIGLGKANEKGEAYFEVKKLIIKNKPSTPPQQKPTPPRTQSEKKECEDANNRVSQKQYIKENRRPSEAELMKDAKKQGLQVSDDYTWEDFEDYENSEEYSEPESYEEYEGYEEYEQNNQDEEIIY